MSFLLLAQSFGASTPDTVSGAEGQARRTQAGECLPSVDTQGQCVLGIGGPVMTD